MRVASQHGRFCPVNLERRAEPPAYLERGCNERTRGSTEETARSRRRDPTPDSGTWAAQKAPELRQQISAALTRIEPPDLALLWLLVGDLTAQPK